MLQLIYSMGRKLIKFSQILFLLTVSVFCSRPVFAQNLAFDAVHVSNEISKETGNGLRFATITGCITVTPAHVTIGDPSPIITPMKSGLNAATVIDLDRSDFDVAVVQQKRSEQAAACANFPENITIENAIRTATQRQVWFVNPQGDSKIFEVKITGTSTNFLFIEMTRDERLDGKRFLEGMSGSAVVFDGVPVAILQRIEQDGKVRALRLDAFRRQNPNLTFTKASVSSESSTKSLGKGVNTQSYVNGILGPVPIQKNYAPYDIRQLPKEFRNIVIEARATKKRAEGFVKSATATKQKAQEASQLAKQLPRQQANNGLAHYKAKNGNDYSGEVQTSNNGKTISSDGYGVTVTGPGANMGDAYFCRWEKGAGCQGAGVTEYAANTANKSGRLSYYGNFKDGKWDGYAVTRYECLKPTFTKQYWFQPNKKAAGVQEMCDGRRFEGEIKSRLNGKNVLWNKDGELQEFGIWEDGKYVEDYEYEWTTLGKIDQSELGQDLRQAYNYEKDKKQKAYKNLCDKNHSLSCYLYGTVLYKDGKTGDNFQKSKIAFIKACDRNITDACYYLGNIYRDGNGVEADIAKSYSYYFNACKHDNKYACNGAASLIENHDFTSADGLTAFDFYNRSCRLGLDIACNAVAN